ncbi:MAG: hypothetical protein LBN95_11045 [Prevotellaceae bacterium]|jgi:hypothetical protein|nr:hypothetical protein [Prevotellaceae bacterium]
MRTLTKNIIPAKKIAFAKISLPNNNNNIAQFKGILTKDEAYNYHQYLTNAREEWNRSV